MAHRSSQEAGSVHGGVDPRVGADRPRTAGMHRRLERDASLRDGGAQRAARATTRAALSVCKSHGGEPVKQDVVLVASEDAETRRELAERLDWDDVPFHLASTAPEALDALASLSAGTRLFVILDFERRSRARVMDALRARVDLNVQLLLLHDAQEDGLSDEKVVEHVRRPAVPGYLYSLVERHGAVA